MPVTPAPFRMPPEWAPHERTWMAWPGPNPTFASDAELDEARRAWAGVARAVRRFEPVTVVVGPGQEEGAAALLGPDVELVVRPLDDAWMRDIGPTFVTDGRTLAAVDWTFNGWGAQGWARWEHDQHIARAVADLTGAPVHSSPLVNEGGAIHVDGEGTVLLTETVQLGEERNPGWTRERVEAEVHARLGTEKAIWLPRGLVATTGRTARSAMSTSSRPSPARAPSSPTSSRTRPTPITRSPGRTWRSCGPPPTPGAEPWRSSRCPRPPCSATRTASGSTTPTSTTTSATTP